MKERVEKAAKLIIEYDGTLESADSILDRLNEITRLIKQEFMELQRESDVVDGLSHYILAKRNKLAHGKTREDEEFYPFMELTSKQERVEAVLDAASALMDENILVFSTKDIMRQLGKKKIDLGVSYPPAVVATILSADKRFKKNDIGMYEYVGKSVRETRADDIKPRKRQHAKKLATKEVMPK